MVPALVFGHSLASVSDCALSPHFPMGDYVNIYCVCGNDYGQRKSLDKISCSKVPLHSHPAAVTPDTQAN
jgi:hypothetical protein